MVWEAPLLPLPDNEFDIVYSKGVLTHVQDKLPLFKEVARTLKAGGVLLIDDWLSPIQGKWGSRIQEMAEIENLTLHAETQERYQQLLQQAGFIAIEICDENENYAQYNDDIVRRLSSPTYSRVFVERFDEKAWHDAIKGYQLIADAIREHELLIRRVKCQVPS